MNLKCIHNKMLLVILMQGRRFKQSTKIIRQMHRRMESQIAGTKITRPRDGQMGSSLL